MIQKPKAGFIKNPIFISYTSLKDFLKCPNSYYLKNIYKQSLPPQAGVKTQEPHRIQIASPHLSLGSTVHDSIKWYLDMHFQVTKDQLIQKFKGLWPKYSGKRGGFSSRDEEGSFGRRGLSMLDNFFKNAHVLESKRHNVNFPKLPLFENVLLMGNFDFVGEKTDGSLHVVDFKTSVKDEEDGLQLYIYAILAEANIGKAVSSASFWYLDREDNPQEIVLDPLQPKLEWIKDKAKELTAALKKGGWICIKGDKLCRDCQAYQAIIDGKGEFMFEDYRFKKSVWYLNR